VLVIIFHHELWLETVLRIALESHDKHSRVLRTVVVDRLAAFEHLDAVQELADKSTVSHRQNLYVFGRFSSTFLRGFGG